MVAAWYASIYKAFLIASVIAFFIGFCSTGKTCLNAYLAGYSLLAAGILVLFVRLMNVTQHPPLSMFLTTLFPFVLMLGILAILLYTIILNRDKIIHQQVSKDYYTFSNVTIILFLLQVYLVYSSISSVTFQQQQGRLSKTTSSLLYFLGTLSLLSTYILYNILTYFTTDGFIVSAARG
jgi:hypothetical protein